ncbi:MAG: class I SAM-dependent methyltransferase [Ktedonobacteraceae bacterium]
MSDYIANAESITEMTRLLEQDRLMTQAVSGLLPPGVDPQTVHEVLDVGCGPGGWVREMAQSYPSIHVTGIDTSSLVIDYAQQQVMVDQLTNAHFMVMDFQQMDFPDASFDLVNARLVQWFLTENREAVVREWFRVLRPGGVLRFTESEMSPITNSNVFEQHNVKFITALERMGKTISPGGYHTGVILLLRPMLELLGCEQIQETAHLFNFSAGMPGREIFVQDVIKGMQTMGQVMVKMKVIGKTELARLQEQTRTDMYAPGFWGILFFVSAWGRKPMAEETSPAVGD